MRCLRRRRIDSGNMSNDIALFFGMWEQIKTEAGHCSLMGIIYDQAD
jgi:hypothetical protein